MNSEGEEHLKVGKSTGLELLREGEYMKINGTR